MSEEVKAWLDKAEDDLWVASVLAKETNPRTLPLMNHLQQCVEKLLKAFMIKKGLKYQRTHNLGYLLDSLNEPSLNDFRALAEQLTVYAVESRYPADLDIPSIAEAKSAQESTKQFRDKIYSHLR